MLFDAHCHLSFLDDKQTQLVSKYKDSKFVSMSISPNDFLDQKERFSYCSNVMFGLGAHPWWYSDIELFNELFNSAKIIGEIGLDYSSKSEVKKEDQIDFFSNIVKMSSRVGGRVLSIHAAGSTAIALDILEKYKCADDNACIFHWFSGSTIDLKRAIDMGCYFSVNSRMLQSRRGVCYAQTMPKDRIFVETDLPSDRNHQLTIEDLNSILFDTYLLVERTVKGFNRDNSVSLANELFTCT